MFSDDNSVSYFDINVCEQSPKNAPVEDKVEKYRSAILYTKQKIIASELLKKFYEARDELDQAEQCLWASKEECKKVRIIYNNTLEHCHKLEKNDQLLCLERKELQKQLNDSEDQCRAIQSHANQLKVLVDKYETQLETLKKEKQHQRSNIKWCKKQTASQKDEHDTLINDLCLFRDIVLGRKKLCGHHKTTLKKYDKFNANTDADDSASECSIDDVDVFDHSIASPMPSDSETKSVEDQVHTSIPVKKLEKNINNDDLLRNTIDLDNDSDSGNEVISEDTGRGSSLACFDIEKGLNSPDYYMNNSPLSNDILKEKKNYTDTSTSPITVQIERSDAAISPILFLNQMNNPDIAKMQKSPKGIGITVNPSNFITTRNVATSPILFSNQTNNPDISKMQKSTKDIGITVNPSNFITTRNVATSPILFSNQTNNPDIAKMQKSTKDIGIMVNPSNFITTRNVATSPILFSNQTNTPDIAKMQKSTKDIGITVNPSNFITIRNVATSPIKLQERETSPIKKKHERTTNSMWQHVLKEKATSPIKRIQQEKETTPIQLDELSCNNERVTNEKECLEKNSSEMVNDNHNGDYEVENILSVMRLHRELITPIPKSPAKAHNIDNIQPSCGRGDRDAANSRLLHNPSKKQTASQKDEYDTLDRGADNSRLWATVNNLLNEVQYLKDLFKDRHPGDNNICHNNQDCNDYNVVLNTHKDNLQFTGLSENVHVIKSPQKSIANRLNICDSHKTPECEETLEVHKSQNKDLNYNNNLPREENMIEDYLLKSPLKVVDKVKKTAKLTRLEKLRKKLLPKSKIRRAMTPPNRKVGRRKQLLFKKNFTEHPSVAAINNKAAFEKAVKVMAELKAKENNKLLNLTKNKTVDRSKDLTQEDHIVHSKCYGTLTKDGNMSKTSQPDKLTSPVSRKKSVDGAFDYQKMSPVNKTSSTNLDAFHNHTILPNSITTRSRSRRLSSSLLNNFETPNSTTPPATLPQGKDKIDEVENRRHLKRVALDTIEIEPKRKLRSTNTLHTLNLSEQANKTDSDKKIENLANNITKPKEVLSNNITKPIEDSSNNIIKPIAIRRRSARLSSSQRNESLINKDVESPKTNAVVSYNDLGIFNELSPNIQKRRISNSEKVHHPKESILCKMIEKYAKHSVKCNVKKIPDITINAMCQKLEDGIAHILSVPQNESKGAMNNFVREIQKCNMRYFLAGFMKYMKDPARKNELYNKISAPPAPHMTKSEQVLLYILKELQSAWPSVNFVQIVLSSIEFALFQLNHTPEFGTVESLSHFYAILCRYFKAKSRLRLFILDAMYCIQFKSVALIKQCLDVWMHILPLAHMGMAKTPLVTCIVYLLHFFKCDDKFKRVQEIRDILNRRYFYQVSEWTESKVLEMFKNAIIELRDIPIEKKMLRMSLIILAKRRGPQWCQKHIIKKMLQPLIEKDNVPEYIKEFCVSILGALLKPYPNDMKVHCEIVVNQLLEMLNQDVSPRMKEAIFSSLLYMRRHNPTRVTQALITWNPSNISSELEQLLKDYVREKPAKVWKMTLSKVALA